ncbi:putative SCF ubiquitin ligase complex subunit SKP2 SCDLUD_005016 [Saccharomycodes ludwigii]|uniref:putative SCF ubiquitin ligase complex subunit SKP2 n=1 Tax=Saccharomycodes ludwigii TaxID=36035 RepID=UPI001E873B99|nr:hypothetical protein SCDLUD_005016 [Saccharomycodes ludwigii]KAH3898693.1 hypothetical protein SCDLUD_005016 [Saccharomycodes ludwigii]
MKRLQLFSFPRFMTNNNTHNNKYKLIHDQPSNTEFQDNSNADTNSKDKNMIVNSLLLSLPPKILDEILFLLSDDTSTLLSLCLVNKHLYDLVSVKYLYKHIKLSSKLSLFKFNVIIHSLQKYQMVSKNIRFLVNKIEFIDPECQDSILKYSKYYERDVAVIAGSYTYQQQLPDMSLNINHSRNTPTTHVNYDKNHIGDDKNTSFKNNSSNDFTPAFSSGNKNEKHHLIRSDVYNKLLRKYSKYTYIELMLDIIDYLPNLRVIALTNITPNFVIPSWYSILNDGDRAFFTKILKGEQSMNRDDFKSFQMSKEWIDSYNEKIYNVPRFKTLELTGKTNETVLRPYLLFCFGVFEELKLTNITIDSNSLETPMEVLPLQMTLDSKGYLDLYSPITSLTLNNCSIVVKQGIFKKIHDYFLKLKRLQLINIKSKYDLLLSNCFPLLSNLTIDCNSPCFTTNFEMVNDSYYYEIIEISNPNTTDNNNNNNNNHGYNDSDCNSLPETLVNPQSVVFEKKLKYPPPTSPVIFTYIKDSHKLNGLVNNAKPRQTAALITIDQHSHFTSLKIPDFHVFYHYNHKIWNKLPIKNKNINLKIVNIPFTNVFPMSPDSLNELFVGMLNDDQITLCDYNASACSGDENTYWWEDIVKHYMPELNANLINGFQNVKLYKDIPNVNLWFFLKLCSNFKSVEINMLRKWLFCTPRTRFDWELLLKPLLNGQTPVKVKDKDGFILYKYGC